MGLLVCLIEMTQKTQETLRGMSTVVIPERCLENKADNPKTPPEPPAVWKLLRSKASQPQPTRVAQMT